MFYTASSIDVFLEAGQRLKAVGNDATVFSLFLLLGGVWRTRLHEILVQHKAAEATLMTYLPKEISEKVGSMSRMLHDQLRTLELELNGVAKRTTMHHILNMDLSEFGVEQQNNQFHKLARDVTIVQDHMHDLLDAAEEEIESLRSRLRWQEAANKGQATELAKLRGLANR